MSNPFEDGILVTDVPALNPDLLQKALKQFVQCESDYRLKFLQASYGIAFDGYSYYGQTDSINQGPEDQLHSFVFSDFYSANRYPSEFHHYLEQHWQPLKKQVSSLELNLLQQMQLDAIANQYQQNFAHMMSANFFPPQAAKNNTHNAIRLTEHPDVSLLSVFPFGTDKAFQYQNAEGNWLSAPTTDRIVIFPGHLLEWLTDGQVKALNHRVIHQQDADQTERFSFGLFSLPLPNATLTSNQGNTLTTEAFFNEHLSLWDD